ncbi:MAG TPA: PaaI family thioesterase [Burkholderiales bacterium]|jgi:1,4-dihydroxy-2-naphthoyl-CoA hydrolase|nr:PaaI family thioesterase [Burkholderiales bacterium]
MSGKTGRPRPAPTAKAMADARNVFDHGLPLMLGVRVLEVSAERVIAELPVKREHFNRGGRVGGGVLMAMADAMGAAGSVMHRPEGTRGGGTLESKTNFFSAARGPVLRGTCVPLHIGRTTSVWQTSITDADGRMVAMVVQTQMALPVPGD